MATPVASEGSEPVLMQCFHNGPVEGFVECSFYEGLVEEGFYKGGWKNGNMHGKGELKMSGPGHVTYYATWTNGIMCEEEMIIKTSSLPHTLSKKE